MFSAKERYDENDIFFFGFQAEERFNSIQINRA